MYVWIFYLVLFSSSSSFLSRSIYSVLVLFVLFYMFYMKCIICTRLVATKRVLLFFGTGFRLNIDVWLSIYSYLQDICLELMSFSQFLPPSILPVRA